MANTAIMVRSCEKGTSKMYQYSMLFKIRGLKIIGGMLNKDSGMLEVEREREFSHSLGSLQLEFTQFDKSKNRFLVKKFFVNNYERRESRVFRLYTIRSMMNRSIMKGCLSSILGKNWQRRSFCLEIGMWRLRRTLRRDFRWFKLDWWIMWGCRLLSARRKAGSRLSMFRSTFTVIRWSLRFIGLRKAPMWWLRIILNNC